MEPSPLPGIRRTIVANPEAQMTQRHDGIDGAFPTERTQDEPIGEPNPVDELLQQIARTPNVNPELSRGLTAVSPLVGRFEIIRRLGQGGFGVVYEARDPELGRHVAVKLLRYDRLARSGTVDRAGLLDIFHREAKAAARLNHPNIITIYDYGMHEGDPYLVLELLRGETASRRLERGPLPAEQATALVLQICRGLAHAHGAGVIHRDLKPGNVFLHEDGQVKILDFGLAHVAEALGGGSSILLSAGTPPYMAPERWRNDVNDERTDIFACGVILFEVLCGRLPFDGSEGDPAARHPTLDSQMAGIPGDLVAITKRALAPEPKDRYSSANELAEALLRLAHREDGDVTTAQPYRYLEQFTEGDARWFFGREREIVRLEQMLAARPLVALVGPSGAGKSSLVHAGLVPRLRRERTVVTMRPGSEPLQRLYERLVEVCGEKRVTRILPDAEQLVAAPGRAGRLLREHAHEASASIVLIVDQLEELVTQVHASEVRRAFAKALVSLADDAAGPIRVVVTVRGDFLIGLTEDAQLRELLARNMMLLGPPDADALAETLRAPAARLGHEYETELIEEMVAAVADEAAPLPLLQLAASRLWERRDRTRRILSRAGLAAAGGVAGILAAHANEVLDGLSGGDEIAVGRRILCDLVTDVGTRRRYRREELLARFEDPQAGPVLEHLVSGRLVTAYRVERVEWVELAHESLISGWTLLQSWLDEDRVDRQFRERLLAAAALWHERRQPEELLWRGDTLDEALRWRRRYRGSPSVAERQFLSRSEARLVQARRMRRRLFFGAAALVTGVAVTSLVVARGYREAAREARLRALVKTAAASPDPLLGSLLLAELQGQPEPPGGAAAAALLAAQAIPLAVLRGHEEIVIGIAFSPDGSLFATTSSDGTARIWRADGTGRPIVLRGHGTGTSPELFAHKDVVSGIEFSPDGGRVVTAGKDGTARIWRTDGTGAPVVLRHSDPVRRAQFTPDGTGVVTVCTGEAARLWRADGGGEPIVFRHEAPSQRLSTIGRDPLSPDGKLVVTVGDDDARVWQSDGGREPVVLRGRGPPVTATFSPDSARVLVRYADEARIWQADGLGVPIVLPIVAPGWNLAGYKTTQAFSPDGARVAVWAGDGISIYSVDGKGAPVEIPGRFYTNLTIAFSADGTRLLTATEKEVHLWPLDGRGPSDVLRGGPGFNANMAVLSRDGSRIVTAHKDGLVRIWAVGALPGVRVFRGHRDVVWTARVSPDGKLLATASLDGTARLWPLDGGAPVVLAPGTGPLFSATFTPDGAKVLVGADDGRLRVWPRTGGEPVVLPASGYAPAVPSPDGAWIATVSVSPLPSHQQPKLIRADGTGEPVWLHAAGLGNILDMSFSPDGSRVAATSLNGARIWRIDRPGEAEAVLPIFGPSQVLFHPSGTMLVTSPRYSRAELRFWSLDGRELPSLKRLGGPSVAWSPDGERIATGLLGGEVRVEWLDRREEPIILNGHEASVESVSFAPDGRLASASIDGTARLWLVDWAALVAALRSATTACLTPSERTSHLGETPAEADAAWASCERRFGRAP